MQKKIKHPIEVITEEKTVDYKQANLQGNMLLSFTLATACTAVVIKTLKKSELALLGGLMLTPIVLFCLKNKKGFKGCERY